MRQSAHHQALSPSWKQRRTRMSRVSLFQPPFLSLLGYCQAADRVWELQLILNYEVWSTGRGRKNNKINSPDGWRRLAWQTCDWLANYEAISHSTGTSYQIHHVRSDGYMNYSMLPSVCCRFPPPSAMRRGRCAQRCKHFIIWSVRSSLTQSFKDLIMCLKIMLVFNIVKTIVLDKISGLICSQPQLCTNNQIDGLHTVALAHPRQEVLHQIYWIPQAWNFYFK